MPPLPSLQVSGATPMHRGARKPVFATKGPKRHQKLLRDNISGITNGSIRRLARRGGVRRVSSTIYPEVRVTILMRLREILRQIVIILEHLPVHGDMTIMSRKTKKTVSVAVVIFVLKRLGSPIAGFGTVEAPDTRQYRAIRERDE